MRQHPKIAVEQYRVARGEFASNPGRSYGAFFNVPGPCGMYLTIIASDGLDSASQGWEHVSVSGRRCPNWQEMCFVKDIFFEENESVMQFHPPRNEYVNNFSTCLHLWRHRANAVTLPPALLVGVKKLGTLA